MTGDVRPGAPLGFEAFGSACGLAVVAGALARIVPGFVPLTVTLVALSVAGWASQHRRGVRSTVSAHAGVAFGVLGAAVAAFAFSPPLLVPWRALLLGLAVVPLWLSERSRPAARRGRR